jgi:hypothetical protein
MDKERRFRPPVVGGSSLLVIFAVLCLTVFALLCLSTVQAGGRLARASARAVADYYAADGQAEEIFARLRTGELPDGVTADDNIYSYTCPISDTQQLCVELKHTTDGWDVLRWQAQSVAEWDADDTLNVWDGT